MRSSSDGVLFFLYTVFVFQLLQQLEPLDVQLHEDIEYFLKKYKENSSGVFKAVCKTLPNFLLCLFQSWCCYSALKSVMEANTVKVKSIQCANIKKYL
jgi:hypothetical protein